jgi:hypothetical protein
VTPTETIYDNSSRNQSASESIKSYLDDCCFDMQVNPNSTLSGTEAYIIKMISKIAVGSATVWWSVIELRQFIKNRKSL